MYLLGVFEYLSYEIIYNNNDDDNNNNNFIIYVHIDVLHILRNGSTENVDFLPFEIKKNTKTNTCFRKI